MALDNFRTIELIWDKANKSIIKSIKTASSDTTGRYFSVKILDGGQEVTLNNAKLQLYWEHPNFNTSGTDDFNTVNNGGLFKMAFSEAMLTNIGELNAYLVLNLPDGKITSGGFPIKVFKGATSGAVVPSNGDSTLVVALENALDKIKIIEDGAEAVVLEDGFVTTPKIANNAVTLSKIDFVEKSKNLFNKDDVTNGFKFDDITGETIPETIYSVSGYIPVEAGADVYKNKNGGLQEYDLSKSLIKVHPSVGRRGYKLTENTHFVRVSMAISNQPTYQLEYGTVETSYTDYHQPTLTEDIKVNLDNFGNEDVDNLSSVIRGNLLSGNQIKLELGDINPVDMTKVSQAPTRARAINTPFTMKSGETLELLNSNIYQMAITTEEISGFVDGWDSISYTADKDILVAVQFKRVDNGNINLDDLSKNISFKSNERFATFGDISSTGKGGVKYVTLSGSDENSGNSTSEGYATLQKALDENPSKIIIENGDYFQSATKTHIKDLTIMPLDPQGAPVRILGGVELKSPTVYNSIYYFDYSEQNTYYNNVFVSKTQQPIQDASRPMYYANLWEVGNGEDYNMKPVLTLSECENEVGTFYYDGAKIYLNPKNKDNTFVPVNRETGLNLRGDKVTILPLIEARYFDRDPLNLDYVRELSAIGVVGSHSARADGFSLDNTSGTLDKCTARFNMNDGFNPHFAGKTTFIDCIGSDNGDDGISHHEVCVGTIIGGKYERNGSGGVTPANNAKVTITGAIIRGNGIGISQNVNQDVETVSKHNLITGNDIGVVSNSKGNFVSIGDVIQDNVTDVQGVLEQY